jgi:hypothetical protein
MIFHQVAFILLVYGNETRPAIARDVKLVISGRLVKVQVKCAWQDAASGNFVVDTRRTQTNRRIMLRKEYQLSNFDFALVYLPECNLFYVFPVEIFISYGSEIHMVEMAKRQRRPRSSMYRDAWHTLEAMAESQS